MGYEHITALELAWLAGLLEGEGCFGGKLSATVTLVMTDRDVVDRVARLLGRPVRGPYNVKSGHKPAYHVTLHSKAALALMERLRPLMGQRRRAKIESILADWKLRACKTRRTRPQAKCHADRPHYAHGRCRACYRRERRDALRRAA